MYLNIYLQFCPLQLVQYFSFLFLSELWFEDIFLKLWIGINISLKASIFEWPNSNLSNYILPT